MAKRVREGASVVRSTRWAPAQRVRSQRQWSDEAEAEFLDALAGTANVSMACEEAGVGHTSVYRRRRDNAAFAHKWQAALEQGYARLEMEMVRSAVDSLTGLHFDATRPVAPMAAETALNLLRLHRQAVTGEGRRSGYRADPPKRLEEVQDELIRKAEAIRRARPVGRDPT